MPVIQLRGLPGSGKSTLARHLLTHLGWERSFRIGTYHKRFPLTSQGDAEAWAEMLRDMRGYRWDRFIFENAGVNERWKEVIEQCGPKNVVTFKLECQLPELLRRIAAKGIEDQNHGDWFPPNRFRNKSEFVQAVFADFSRGPADVILDTTRATSKEIFDLAIRFLSAQSHFSWSSNSSPQTENSDGSMTPLES